MQPFRSRARCESHGGLRASRQPARQILEFLMAVAFHPLRVSDVRRETPEAVSIAFAVPPALADDYRYVPGQHLTLRLTRDGEEIRRSYSICSGLDDADMRIAVKADE